MNQIPTGALAFLSTPYTQTPDRMLAYREACRIAGELMRAGLHIFAPIPHCYGICDWSEVDDLDWKFWLAQNQPILERCDVLIVVQLEHWQHSRGVAHEISHFTRAYKPIFDLDPQSMRMTKRPRAKPHRERYDGTPTDEIAKLTNEYLETDQPIPARASESHQGIAPACDSQGGSAGGDFS